jgi:hypothetical protein
MDIKKLPTYDLVLMIDVIEHLTKKNAHKIIKELRCPILISTPLEDYRKHYENSFEDHISYWTIDDFKIYPYEDYTFGLSTIVLIDSSDQENKTKIKKENERLVVENKKLTAELNSIKSSKGWSILEKARQVKKKFK